MYFRTFSLVIIKFSNSASTIVLVRIFRFLFGILPLFIDTVHIRGLLILDIICLVKCLK